jgi:hypothetical protein
MTESNQINIGQSNQPANSQGQQIESSKPAVSSVASQSNVGMASSQTPVRAFTGSIGSKVPSPAVPGVVGSQPVARPVVEPEKTSTATVSPAPVVVATKIEQNKQVVVSASQINEINLQKKFGLKAKERIKAKRLSRVYPWESSLKEIEAMRNEKISWSEIAEDINSIYGELFDLSSGNKKSSGMSLAKQFAKLKKELKAKV